MKGCKTNAARLLDRAGIAYKLVSYPVDANDLSAEHMARELGISPGAVYKTLVLRGDKTGCFVCLVPGGAELDLKKAARASGNKSCSLIPLKDLQPLTGYLRGGCSPVGMKKALPTYIDRRVFALEEVHISAGQRGCQFLLRPQDLLAATKAVAVDLVSGEE